MDCVASEELDAILEHPDLSVGILGFFVCFEHAQAYFFNTMFLGLVDQMIEES